MLALKNLTDIRPCLSKDVARSGHFEACNSYPRFCRCQPLIPSFEDVPLKTFSDMHYTNPKDP